ncbi:Aldo/keto reductase [Kockiozyma suomiensis]|uniref:Aldo/keto reductase n=1 Tax=Kockiozyma suomiensis TaxID=1337062 RepID=UPI003343CA0B
MTSLAPVKAAYKKLGTSGFRVSVPILGCMSFGDSKWQPWVLNEEDALPVLKAAYDMGITSWDTANMYSNGKSEMVIAAALKKYSIPRSKVQILTKVFTLTDGEDPDLIGLRYNANDNTEYSNLFGLSRTAIFHQVNGCLRRLETDYIDLLQIHRFDYATPIEETMCALNDLVRSGKVRYIGASSMYAFQFAMMQACAEKNGWTKFVSMQNHYNLLYREEEREMNKYCDLTGVGLIPWGPLAAGALARAPDTTTVRSNLLPNLIKVAPTFYDLSEGEAPQEILKRVREIAEKKGYTRAETGLAWVMSKVSSPLVGASTVKRLEEAVSAAHKTLEEDEIKYLEEPYVPRPNCGFA